jgi:hypothetical protein
MDDQRTDREGSEGVTNTVPAGNRQYSLRNLFVVASWISLWLGAWAFIDYHNTRPHAGASMFSTLLCATIIITCPLAVFGYIVGRAKLGFIAGLVTTALIMILSFFTHVT